MTADRSFTCSRENVCPVGRHEPPQYLFAQLPDPVEGPDQELRGEECREFRMLVWAGARAGAAVDAGAGSAGARGNRVLRGIRAEEEEWMQQKAPEATESCEVFGRRRKSECD